jgi:hypothetical protein
MSEDVYGGRAEAMHEKTAQPNTIWSIELFDSALEPCAHNFENEQARPVYVRSVCVRIRIQRVGSE